jgi:hypothetical protein
MFQPQVEYPGAQPYLEISPDQKNGAEKDLSNLKPGYQGKSYAIYSIVN